MLAPIRRSRFWYAVTLKLLFVAILSLLFWTVSLPAYIDITLILIIATICIRAEFVSLILLCSSVSISLFIIGYFRPYLFPERPYYREHEKYALGEFYQKNITDTVYVPHGDLSAIDPQAPLSLKEPRVVKFKTDSRGYRNQSDFSGEKIVLAGDSFAVGTGTDYNDTLPALLRSEHGINTYSIAYPGAVLGYYDKAQSFLNTVSRDVNFGIFVFEGNDFASSLTADQVGFHQARTISPTLAKQLNDYDAYRTKTLAAFGKPFSFSSDLFLLSRRLEREFFNREDTYVSYNQIGKRWVGFLNSQSIASIDPAPGFPGPIPEEVGKLTRCVFFVPSKLRVYRKWAPSEIGSQVKVPPPSLAAMRIHLNHTGAKIIDLSPLLEAAAEELLPFDKYVYWRDDTHWNGNGMRAVVGAVADCLKTK